MSFLLVMPPTCPTSCNHMTFNLRFLIPLNSRLMHRALKSIRFLYRLIYLSGGTVYRFLSFLYQFHFNTTSSSLASNERVPFTILYHPLTRHSLPFKES